MELLVCASLENKSPLPCQLYILRRLVSRENRAELESVLGAGAKRDWYICSLSSQTIVYKGQLTPAQLKGYYYKDLGSSDFTSYMALVRTLMDQGLGAFLCG